MNHFSFPKASFKRRKPPPVEATNTDNSITRQKDAVYSGTVPSHNCRTNSISTNNGNTTSNESNWHIRQEREANAEASVKLPLPTFWVICGAAAESKFTVNVTTKASTVRAMLYAPFTTVPQKKFIIN